MRKLAKTQENRDKGEMRTQALLADAFWLLKRSVDVDGADFLLQRPADTLDDLRSRNRTIEVFGVVQAKYFEHSNQVKIDRIYVEDVDGTPRPEFFAFLHSDDHQKESVCYFFSASEIAREFYLNEAQTHYCFSITQDRTYEKFRNLPNRKIIEAIETGMSNTQVERNHQFVARVYLVVSRADSSIRSKTIETPEYVYSITEKSGIVTATKRSKASGAEAVVGTVLGTMKSVSFNPETDTFTPGFEDL